MSQENVETVRQAFAGWDVAWSGAAGLEDLLVVFDDRAVTRRLAPMPDHDRRVAEFGMYASQEQALEAAGLSE